MPAVVPYSNVSAVAVCFNMAELGEQLEKNVMLVSENLHGNNAVPLSSSHIVSLISQADPPKAETPMLRGETARRAAEAQFNSRQLSSNSTEENFGHTRGFHRCRAFFEGFEAFDMQDVP